MKLSTTQKINPESWKNLLYPASSLLMLGIVLICFFAATRFLSKNIDRIFYDQPVHDASTDINMTQLQLVAKKIGATISQPEVKGESISTDDSLQIEILNGSGEKGAAKSLKTIIATAGFSVTKIGDAHALDLTELQIKTDLNNKKTQDIMNLENIMRGQRPFSETILPSTSKFDIVIVIGSTNYSVLSK